MPRLLRCPSGSRKRRVMKPARAFLQVVLSVFLVAAMVVSSGFAATKKLDRHRNPSRDWNDLSLQNGDLLDVGSSVPGGVGSLRLSQAGDPGGILTLPPSSPDNWNGSTGNWSNAGQWSAGEPGASSDVTIYSGGNDLVTLDVGSTTINSLTLGGVYKGYTSELTDGGTKQVLSITNALNIGQTGDFDISLYLYGGSTVTAGADSSNAGTIDLDNASTLKVTGSLDNSGKIFTGAFYAGGNTLTVTGTLTNESGAWFQVIEAGDVSNIGSLVNNGVVTVGRGATLNLTEQPGGITDIVAGSEFTIDLAGTFLAGANNAFYQLG